jgi:hypothetical protein
MCHAPAAHRGAARELHDVFNMCRSHDARVVNTNIHEQLVEFDILLGVGQKQ